MPYIEGKQSMGNNPEKETLSLAQIMKQVEEDIRVLDSMPNHDECVAQGLLGVDLEDTLRINRHRIVQ